MEEQNKKSPIRSFRDLEVYRDSYSFMLEIHRKVLPKIPSKEKFDLGDQLSRSSKAIPRLIAEGYAKKHQKLGFQKYLDDAMAEVNETIVSLEQVRDLYRIESELCQELINKYDVLARRLYRLSEAWEDFKRKPKTKTNNHTGI